MASKQQEAKEKMGYVAKPRPKVCANCANYTSVIEEREGAFSTFYNEEKNIRCKKGDFAVKKMATCNEYEAKQ